VLVGRSQLPAERILSPVPVLCRRSIWHFAAKHLNASLLYRSRLILLDREGHEKKNMNKLSANQIKQSTNQKRFLSPAETFSHPMGGFPIKLSPCRSLQDYILHF